MPDIVPIDTTRSYFTSGRATIGGPLHQFTLAIGAGITNASSGNLIRAVNPDILYPIRSGNPFPVSSGLVYP